MRLSIPSPRLAKLARVLGVDLALAAGALIIGLAIAEGAVRVIAPQVTLFPRYISSSEYPIEMPPNAHLLHAQGGRWRFTYTTNQYGRRGGPFADPAHLSGNGVVVLGDSFSFGIGVEDQDVYSSVLQRQLAGEFHVVNGGMSGWGLDSHIKWFYQTGLQFEPEIVVLQFTANDPTDDEGLTSIENGRFRFHPFEARKPAWQEFLSGSRLFQSSHLYVLARQAYDNLSPAPSQAAPDEGTLDAASRRYARLLRSFAERVDSAGARLLFVSVTQSLPGDTGYGYDVSRFPLIETEIEQLADEGLLTFVDLPLDEFSRLPGSPEGHQWGPDHHRLVGVALAAHIEDPAVGTQEPIP